MSAPEQPAGRFFETKCGRVKMTAPTDNETYWRLEYMIHGQRQQTSGGRTYKSAVAKAERIVAKLDAGITNAADTRVETALDEYIEYSKATFAPNTWQKDEPDLRKAFVGFGRVRCADLDRVVLGKALASSNTKISSDRRRSRLRRFLAWGYAKGYFSEAQTHLMDHLSWTPPAGKIAPPSRSFQPAPTNESERYVTEDQVPLHNRIADLGDAMSKTASWGKLCVELTYATGVRSGEMYALDGPAVKPATCEIAVNWQALSLSGLPTRQSRPKHGRTRVTNYPEVTLTGFRLADALAERLEQIRFEQSKGKNPRGLLFPAVQGGWQWATGFGSDHFTPAALEAGWDRLEWINEDGRTEHLWVHTMHSLRHRFARDRIDTYEHSIAELQAVGGWRSGQVVWERYYGQTNDLLVTSGEKMRRKR